jgi:adenylate cyclase
MKKINLFSPWTALITLIILIIVKFQSPTFIESIKLRYFDTLITSQPEIQNTIHTVNIDESALEKYGQWPFSRDVYADIIKDLYNRGAGLVVFNVLMPEKDRSGKDSVLAETLKDYPVILSNVGSDINKNQAKNPGAVMIGDPDGKVIEYPGIIANIPELENEAYGVGLASTLPEIDGVNRRIPLVVKSGETLYPSIGLEVLRVLAQDPSFQIKFHDYGIEKLRIPQFGIISTDNIGRVWIDWQQKGISHSLTNLPDNFDSSIVIVGTTASGIANPISTSVGEVWPHEVQTSIIGTLVNQVNIQRPDWADGAEILVTIVLSLIILILSRWTYVGLGTSVVLLGATIPATMYGYSHYKFLLDGTLILGIGILVMLHAYGVKFISEFRQKQQIKKQFGSYLSPALVEKLQKNPELLKLGGETRELSIMFTDVRGFTSISEHYGENVQGLTQIMNRYMTAMTQKILDNNGTLDKYIGDAQMAFWNAPLDDKDHAKHAVKTALEMLGDLDAFNREVAEEGVPPFGMGLGINSGSVVVGNMGSNQRFDYTCLGDAVNLASRLEGQSKTYGVKIILGPITAEQVKDEYNTVELDCIAVKGKKVGVKIFTVTETPDIKGHKKYLRAYYDGEWKAAKLIAGELKKTNPELEQYYTNMIERMNDGLPSDWDGTFRATSK